MKTTSSQGATPLTSDAAVAAKTGKSWAQWFAVLDAAGANKMSHKEIVAYLRDNHDIGSWWQQMVTVGYEQARGLREKHARARWIRDQSQPDVRVFGRACLSGLAGRKAAQRVVA